MAHYSVNEMAARLLETEVIPRAKALNIEVFKLNNGATVLDMGIKAKGGFRAARYFVEAGMGGLGRMEYSMTHLGEHIVPKVHVVANDPSVCEMASYVAWLRVDWHGNKQVVSGPVRSILGEDAFASAVSYRDPDPSRAVCGVQTEMMPDEELAENIALSCGITPDRLYIMAARTGCVVGSVQVCARNVEQAMPTIYDRGISMCSILEGNAVTPLLCIVDDEETAYGRVNDCLIYGQEANITIDCDDETILQALEDIPFSKNKDVYGIGFEELFRQCGNNWANVPRDWDAPCKINFFNVRTGSFYSTGVIGTEPLIRAYMGNGSRL